MGHDHIIAGFAVGRDYLDAAPVLRRSRPGGRESMDVSVAG